MGVILPQGGKIWQNKREREMAIHYCIINSVILGVMHKFLSDINLYSFYVQILHKQMGYILYIQYYSSLCFPSQPLGYYKKTEQKMTSIGEDVEGGARPLRTIGGNVSMSRAGCCGKTVKKFLKHLKIESSLTQNFRF